MKKDYRRKEDLCACACAKQALGDAKFPFASPRACFAQAQAQALKRQPKIKARKPKITGRQTDPILPDGN